jgi:hypothetical protein
MQKCVEICKDLVTNSPITVLGMLSLVLLSLDVERCHFWIFLYGNALPTYVCMLLRVGEEEPFCCIYMIACWFIC